jgi:hypothetical protein
MIYFIEDNKEEMSNQIKDLTKSLFFKEFFKIYNRDLIKSLQEKMKTIEKKKKFIFDLEFEI